MKPTAQDIQDEIFREMSPAKKLEVGFQLWSLGKELAGEKLEFHHGTVGPKTPSYTRRPNS